jgi:hypothetical protein
VTHDHGHDHHTVVEDRDGAMTFLYTLIAVVVVGFLVWLLVFSGLVFDRSPDRDVNREPGTGTQTVQPDTGTGETVIPTTIPTTVPTTMPSPIPTAT